MGIINRKAFPSAIKLRQAVFQEWIVDRLLLRVRVSIPGFMTSVITPASLRRLCTHRCSNEAQRWSPEKLRDRTHSGSHPPYASSHYRTFTIALHSVLELSFVYELVYFIAGTCFSRKFPTSQRILTNVGRQDGILALRDRINASL